MFMRFCGGGIGHINQDCRWTIGELDSDDAMAVDSDELEGQSIINPESEEVDQQDSDSDSDPSSDSDSSSSIADDSGSDDDLGPEDGEEEVDRDDDGYGSL